MVPVKSENVIVPSVKINGEVHEMEKMFNELDISKLPILTSVGMIKLDNNRRNQYVSFVMTSQGSKVLKIEVDEPNLYAIAVDATKQSIMTRVIETEEDDGYPKVP